MPNFSLQFKAMGSQMQVWLNAPTEADARILAGVPDWFESWESRLSRFRPTSELSALNARAGDWLSASSVLYEVVEEARDAAEATDGVFNPLILNALEAVGYDHSFDPAQTADQRPLSAEAVTVPAWQSIELDEAKQAIRLPAGARIDLGGIAKGWAAQQAADRLAMYGACLVDAGGDLVARGSPDASGGWIIRVPTLDESDDLFRLLLVDEAAATSGTDYRQWQRDGKLMHHLIDPRTGRPSESSIARSTVIAREATDAVVWAKVSLITQQFPNYPTTFVHRDGTVLTNWEAQPS